MLVNLWNSRGLSITGIEKKSYRNDWQRELKNPQKQEAHYKYCDYFYLLTDKENVAKIEEIPATWGWYHINEKGILKTMKAAPKLKSIPVDRPLLCCMLRRAADKKGFVRIDSIEDVVKERVEKVRADVTYGVQEKAKSYDSLRALVDEFDKASGLKLDDYWFRKTYVKEMGEAVKVLIGDIGSQRKSLNYAFQTVKSLYDEMKKGIDALNALPENLIEIQNGDK